MKKIMLMLLVIMFTAAFSATAQNIEVSGSMEIAAISDLEGFSDYTKNDSTYQWDAMNLDIVFNVDPFNKMFIGLRPFDGSSAQVVNNLSQWYLDTAYFTTNLGGFLGFDEKGVDLSLKIGKFYYLDKGYDHRDSADQGWGWEVVTNYDAPYGNDTAFFEKSSIGIEADVAFFNRIIGFNYVHNFARSDEKITPNSTNNLGVFNMFPGDRDLFRIYTENEYFNADIQYFVNDKVHGTFNSMYVPGSKGWDQGILGVSLHTQIGQAPIINMLNLNHLWLTAGLYYDLNKNVVINDSYEDDFKYIYGAALTFDFWDEYIWGDIMVFGNDVDPLSNIGIALEWWQRNDVTFIGTAVMLSFYEYTNVVADDWIDGTVLKTALLDTIEVFVGAEIGNAKIVVGYSYVPEASKVENDPWGYFSEAGFGGVWYYAPGTNDGNVTNRGEGGLFFRASINF